MLINNYQSTRILSWSQNCRFQRRFR